MSDAVQKFEDGLARVAAGFEASFAECPDESSLRAAAAKLIGGSGEVTQLLKLMPQLPGDRRKELGQRVNVLKRAVQSAFDARLEALARAARQADLGSSPIDPSLPGRGLPRGALHPITRTMDALLDVFASIGFEITDAPEIELADFNFTRLGFPPDHPATDMQDSFFVGDPAAPEGGASGLGTSPESTMRRRERAGSGTGTALSSAFVYGCFGDSQIARDDATSTIRPRYMTATRWLIQRTTARSCATKRYVRPSSSCRSIRRFMICACIETSSADTGSSPTMTSGERARARAMPIRWRCPPENSWG